MGWKIGEILAEKPKQIILKDPNTCDYYKEVGCIKDVCDCYTMITKQEKIEEVAEKYANDWEEIHPELYPENMTPIAVSKIDFIEGAKWQAERMYSEEEVLKLIFKFSNDFDLKRNIEITSKEQIEWFKKFKKK